MNPNDLPTFNPQAKLFKLLAHPNRVAILEALRGGEQCVCHLEAALGLRQAYLSQQIAVLREAGVLQDRRDGWNIFYHVARPEVFTVLDAAAVLTGQSAAVSLRPPIQDCPCPKCTPRSE